jgi:hypothetical protein
MFMRSLQNEKTSLEDVHKRFVLQTLEFIFSALGGQKLAPVVAP